MWTGEEVVQSGAYNGVKWRDVPAKHIGTLLMYNKDNFVWEDVLNARKEITRRIEKDLEGRYKFMWKPENIKQDLERRFRYTPITDFYGKEQGTISKEEERTLQG